MKKVYFGGTFNLSEDEKAPLSERLRNDYRALLLKDSYRMVNYSPETILRTSTGCTLQYVGPFYCEEAAPGDYTSTNCEVVVRQEYRQVTKSDVVVIVFTDWPSIGTTVELEWAIQQNKQIIILYEVCKNASEYTLPSGLWFAIQDAIQRSKKLTVQPFNEYAEIAPKLDKILEGEGV